jgi:twitching motility protein PilT
MQVGQEKFGMQTMNQSLAALYQRRLISLETAMSRSSDVDELRNLVSQGPTATRAGAPRVAAG